MDMLSHIDFHTTTTYMQLCAALQSATPLPGWDAAMGCPCKILVTGLRPESGGGLCWLVDVRLPHSENRTGTVFVRVPY